MTGIVRSAAVLLGVAAGLALLSGRTEAQDTHYWNSQYGPHSQLLGGTIVGSVGDMSATYYNPGALGYIENPELLLSANVFQKSALRLEDGAGGGQDLVSSDFRPLPNMVAGAFRFSWLGKNRLAYSVLTRYHFEAQVQAAETGRRDVLPEQPGDEDFADGFEFTSDVSETWVGLSWAPRVDDRVGFGVTSYFTIRSQSSEERVFAQAMGSAQRLSLYQDLEAYDLQFYGLLFKAGVGIDLTPVTLGLTVTTPTLGLGGSGSAVKNLSRVQLLQDSTGTRADTFVSSVQPDVSADYRSPLSVAIGGAWRIGGTRIHATAEWFQAVDPYAALELQPFVSQETGEVLSPTVTGAAESVVNWGVGLEHRFGDHTKGYLSFITDSSASSEESDITVTAFDVYHVGGGGAFTVQRTQFSAGVAYAWGSDQVTRRVNLDPSDDESVLDNDTVVDLTYRRLTFMLGFGVQF